MVSKVTLTTNQEDWLIDAYQSHRGIKYILKHLGISAGTFYRVLDKRNVPRFSKRRGKTEERLSSLSNSEKKTIIKQYDKGVSAQVLYETWDINKNTLYTLIDGRKKYTDTLSISSFIIDDGY